MADVIDLTHRFHDRDNLIASRPLELRRGDWNKGYVIMCTRHEADRYEAHRRDALSSPGHRHISFVPDHFSLEGGLHYTVLGLFRYREDEAMMRRVYRLAGLMECVTNAPSHILRTDLLRRFYKTILEERQEINVVWRGNVRNFLLPVHPEHYNPDRFLHLIANAQSLKDLYHTIESETNSQFDILSRFYVFYIPENLTSFHSHRPGS